MIENTFTDRVGAVGLESNSPPRGEQQASIASEPMLQVSQVTVRVATQTLKKEHLRFR